MFRCFILFLLNIQRIFIACSRYDDGLQDREKIRSELTRKCFGDMKQPKRSSTSEGLHPGRRPANPARWMAAFLFQMVFYLLIFFNGFYITSVQIKWLSQYEAAL
ncbi:MAG: hypothetical protein DRH37_02205 [Deltaproteobacteria bacterium]|nr:MAG: hypothetical protein DRH37_02205 [Deltaproteobacteria bacterium]